MKIANITNIAKFSNLVDSRRRGWFDSQSIIRQGGPARKLRKLRKKISQPRFVIFVVSLRALLELFCILSSILVDGLQNFAIFVIFTIPGKHTCTERKTLNL